MSRPKIVAAALLASSLSLPATASARGTGRSQAALDVATACAGVSEPGVISLPRETVESVSPLYQRTRSGKQLSGATVIVRAEPGRTAEQLQRAFQCQIARCSVRPVSDSCPLAIQGVRARVEPADRRFVVQLWSDDAAAGREILARSRSLRPAAGS